MWRTAARTRLGELRRPIAIALLALFLTASTVVALRHHRASGLNAEVDAARHAAEAGEFDEALRRASAVLAERPQDTRARAIVIRTLLERDLVAAAEEQARVLLRTDKRHRFAHAVLANGAHERGDAEAALPHAEAAGDLAFDVHAWALRALGRDADAAAVLRRKSSRRGDTLSDALMRAQTASAVSGPRSGPARDAWGDVRRLAIALLVRRSDDSYALEARARAELTLGDDDVAARVAAGEALAAGAGSDVARLLAALLAREGDVDALVALGTDARMRVDDGIVRAVARELLRLREIAAARAVVAAAIVAAPESAAIHEVEGDVAFSAGEPGLATTCWTRAFEIDGRPSALMRLAAAECDAPAGSPRPWLARLTEVRPEVPATWALQAAASLRDGHAVRAREQASRALVAAPGLTAARVVLFHVALVDRDEAESERQFKALLAGETPAPHTLAELSWVATSAGLPVLGARLAERALGERPGDPGLTRLAARAWLASSLPEAARRLLESDDGTVDDDPEARALWVAALASERGAEVAARRVVTLPGLARWERAELLLSLGDCAGARAALGDEGMAGPRGAAALARVLAAEGRPDAARRQLRALDEPTASDLVLLAELELLAGGDATTVDAIAMALDTARAADAAEYVRGRAAAGAGDTESARTHFARLLALRPDSVSGALRLAECLDPVEDAVSLALRRAAVARDPDSVAARVALAAALRRGLESAGASAATAQEVAALTDVAPELPLRRAAALLAASRFDETETACRQVLVGDTDNGLARTILALAELHQGRPQAAWDDLERASDSAPPDLHAGVRAVVLLALGRVDEALEAARVLDAQGDASPAVLTVLVRALVAGEQLEEARDVVERLAAARADAESTWLLAALVAEATGDEAAVDAALRRAATCDPESGEAAGRLAVRLADRGDVAEATALLVPLPEGGAWNAYAHARLMLAAGRSDDALPPLRVAAEAIPAAAVELGGLLESNGMRSESVAVYEAMLRRWPNHSAARVHLAVLLVADDRALDARLHLEQVLTQSPDHVPALNNLALLLAEDGRSRARAREMALRAVALAPDVAALHDTLGSVELLAEGAAAARSHFERALELDADCADAYYHMGLVQLAAGESAAATLSFERALTLEPRAGWAVDARRRLGIAGTAVHPDRR